MSTLTEFSPKLDSATSFLDFDFISMLESGETIVGAAVTASVFSGTDANPENIVSGAETVSGSVVTQKIIGGEVGVIYRLTCSVTTSLGNVKIMRGLLAVLDSNPFEAI